jgi:uncharacterized membrane protein
MIKSINRNSWHIQFMAIFHPRLNVQKKIYTHHYAWLWLQFIAISLMVMCMIYFMPYLILIPLSLVLPVIVLWLCVRYHDHLSVIQDKFIYHLTIKD